MCEEFIEEVLAGRLIIVAGAMVIYKAISAKRVGRQLLNEQVHFVQEQDDGRIFEPPRVNNRLPQHQSLIHLVLHMVSILYVISELATGGSDSQLPYLRQDIGCNR